MRQAGEALAAGYFEIPGAAPIRRWSRALRRALEDWRLPAYAGDRLHPRAQSGQPCTLAGTGRILRWCSSLWYFFPRAPIGGECPASAEENALWRLITEELSTLSSQVWCWHSPHEIPAIGITHCVPNYGRVLHEGLDGHAARLGRLREPAQDDFRLGLEDLLAGIRTWHGHLLASVRAFTSPDEAQCQRRQRLLDALAQVPFRPARTFFEALLSYHLVCCLDGCDNPGRIDQELWPFYQRDLATGGIVASEARALLREFSLFVEANHGWHASLGGCDEAGAPAYNELTRLCLEAARGLSRPNYGLRIRRDMPDALWDAALDSLASGNGLPGLYHDEAYLGNLRDLGVSEQDLAWWNCGGCSETMVHGRSNVGSVDAGINLLLVLEGVLHRHLPTAAAFEDLLEAWFQTVEATVAEVTAGVNRIQEAKARLAPHPLRTLLVDDCIDRGVEFHAGGARYNWSVINLAGLSNVIDSLAAVREVVFERREIAGADLCAVLCANFQGAENLRQRLQRCPRFGNDLPAVDELGARLAHQVLDALARHRPWRGGVFMADVVLFDAYVRGGAQVGATPDGRRAGEPLGDSIGPAQGRDTHGLTAMLRSVTALPLKRIAGTPVLNLRLHPDMFASPAKRTVVRRLVETYFRLGGLQAQINVVDAEILRDAVAHPERHGDLVVRVGGYCARFADLSDSLRLSILERTEHGACKGA